MNGKYYTGHVGDSRIVLGRNNMFGRWISYPMTRDHKPETPKEKKRIEAAGGKVMVKSGIGRVVWKRPRANCDLVYDFIPFLAVARSLGDLWSLNKQQNTFVVSPEPDVHCLPLNPKDRCLILASDGLWNMISCKEAISLTREFEKSKSADLLDNNLKKSPSMHLLEHCLDLWSKSRCRADNTTVLSLIFETEHIEYDFDEFHSIYDFNDYLNFTFIGDTIHSLNNTIDDDLGMFSSSASLNSNFKILIFIDDIKHECENDENVKTIDNEVEYLLNDMLNQVCLNDVDHNKSSLFDAVSDENELTSDQLALIDFDSFNDTATIGDDRVNTNGCFIIKKPEINENSRLISNQQIHAPLSKMTFQQNHTYNGNESYSSTITAPTSNVFNYQHGFNIFNNCDNSFDDNSSTYTTPVTFSYEQTSSNSTTPDSYNTSDNQDAPTQFSTNQFYSESIDTNRTFFNAPLSITPTTTFSNDTTASFVNFLPKFNLKRCYDSDNASTENDFKRFCTNIDTNGSPDSFDTANNSFIQSTAGQCVKQYLSTNNGTTRHSMDIHAMATINE